MQAIDGLIQEKRPITIEERELIEWLLEHRDDEPGEFLAQLDNLSVISKCNCGCPTIYFAADEQRHEPEVVLADYLATFDSHPVGVMLFRRGRLLSSLEVYSCDGVPKSFGLPNIDSLRPLDSPRR